MINTLYLPELREMLATNDVEGMQEFCGALHPARTAEFMEGLTPQEVWGVLRVSSSDMQAEIFGFLEPHIQAEIVELGERSEVAELVGDLAADDRVDLLNDVEQAVVDELLPLLTQEDRRETLRLQAYPEGTAGAVMTTEVTRLTQSMTVHEALEAVSRQAEESETVYYSYVIDEDNHLLGHISARQLVTHYTNSSIPISDLMQRDLVTVLATDDQEAVAEKVADYDFLAIPVVDDERRLLGIITHDDIIDVLREEATEDAHLSAGIDPLEDGYLQTHWFTLAWKRGMWLMILFVAALLTALALRSYEGDFEKVTWLVLFIPLVISSGGNSGSQSATLVIQGMTNGDVAVSDFWRVVKRELLMGLCLGGVLAGAGYLCGLWITSASSGPPGLGMIGPSPYEMLVVPITLILVVICGTLCGGILPLLFRRLGLDPALMSNPFVAGIIDIAGIVIYMNVAIAMIAELSR